MATATAGGGPFILAPPTLPYRDGQAIPPGYELEESANGGMMAGGGAAFGVGYVAGLYMGGDAKFENGMGWLALPVVGPFAAIAARESPCQGTSRTPAEADACVDRAVDDARMLVALMVDGLLQVTGATLFLVGTLDRDRQLVRKTETASLAVTAMPIGLRGALLGVSGHL